MVYKLENKEYLWLIILIPLLVGFWWFIQVLMKKRVGKLGHQKTVSTILPFFSKPYFVFKYAIVVCSLLFLILGLLNPQTGKEGISTRAVGLEVNLVVDVSSSMLAEDVVPSRLEATKKLLYKLIDKLNGNRIGITVFAGEAFNQIPPTSDENILDAVIASLSPDLVPTQGSNIKMAMEMGLQNFNPGNKQQKFIILITDGENHEEDFLPVAKEVKSKGINLHAIGVGSVKGAPIPIYSGRKRQLLKDAEGKTVVTKLDEASLIKLTQEVQGKYSKADNEDGVDDIIKEINRVPQKVVSEKIYSQLTDYFKYFIAISLVLLLIDFFIPAHKLINRAL